MSFETTYSASKEEIIEIVVAHLNEKGFSVIDISLENNKIKATVNKTKNRNEKTYDHRKGYEEASEQGRFEPGDW